MNGGVCRQFEFQNGRRAFSRADLTIGQWQLIMAWQQTPTPNRVSEAEELLPVLPLPHFTRSHQLCHCEKKLTPTYYLIDNRNQPYHPCYRPRRGVSQDGSRRRKHARCCSGHLARPSSSGMIANFTRRDTLNKTMGEGFTTRLRQCSRSCMPSDRCRPPTFCDTLGIRAGYTRSISATQRVVMLVQRVVSEGRNGADHRDHNEGIPISMSTSERY